VFAVKEEARRSDGPGGPSELLEGRSITMQFQGVRAVDGVDIAVGGAGILGLIGPNGAGKTTLVNILTGFQSPTEGSIWLGEQEITEKAPEKRAQLGLARTFQGSRSFGDLTVSENVEVNGVSLGLTRRAAAGRAREALEQVGIAHLAEARAADLTTGQERRLQVARVIAMRPRFVFLDEPTAGLNESETDELVGVIAGLPTELGCGVLLIDHDMSVIMRACAEIVVLDQGRVIKRGTPAEVREDRAVIDAYLGS
jgi:branched-chain amino acid transport system ATP-binding protein